MCWRGTEGMCWRGTEGMCGEVREVSEVCVREVEELLIGEVREVQEACVLEVQRGMKRYEDDMPSKWIYPLASHKGRKQNAGRCCDSAPISHLPLLGGTLPLLHLSWSNKLPSRSPCTTCSSRSHIAPLCCPYVLS